MTAPVRLYDYLFNKSDPDEVAAGQTYLANLNPNSLEVLSDAKLEPSLARRSRAIGSSLSEPGISLRTQSIRSRASRCSIGR